MNAAQQLFWGEVRSPQATQRSLAVCYAVLIADAAGRQRATGEGTDWRPVNEATNLALGLDSARKIDRFRKMAWDIHAAACSAVVGER